MSVSNVPGSGGLVQVAGKQLKIIRKLGGGAFGTVHMVCDAQGNQYALKEIPCEDPHKRVSAEREIKALSVARDERIVQIMAYEIKMHSPGCGYSFLIAEELCHGGDLNSRLDAPSSLQENFKWGYQAADGVDFLHCLGITHRDLKPDNLMLTCTGDIKIGDFGLAREYPAVRNMDSVFATPHLNYMSSNAGAPYWMAPEVFHQRYTEKADVFSLGCVLQGIFFRDSIEDVRCILGPKKMYGAFFTCPDGTRVGLGFAMAYHPNVVQHFRPFFSDPISQLILSTLDYNHHNRPSAGEVKNQLYWLSFQRGDFPPNWANWT